MAKKFSIKYSEFDLEFMFSAHIIKFHWKIQKWNITENVEKVDINATFEKTSNENKSIWNARSEQEHHGACWIYVWKFQRIFIKFPLVINYSNIFGNWQ